MRYIREYIQECLYNRKYSFSRQEVIDTLGLTLFQFRTQLQGLLKKERIKRIARNYFIIVPVEHPEQRVPILWIIDPLMKHLKRDDYYIGLLSAAFLHQAIDEQPANLQIITDKLVHDISLPDSKIEFHVFKEGKSALKEKFALPISEVQVSTREQTALDLIRFHQDCGYLSNVAAVIKKLLTSESAKQSTSEKIFSSAIKNEKNVALLQRFGYILEFIQLEKFASIVENELSRRKMQPILLRPDLAHIKSEKRSERFKIVVNDLLKR